MTRDAAAPFPAGIFLGPRCEGIAILRDLTERILDHHRRYRLSAYPQDAPPESAPAAPSPPQAPAALARALEELLGRLGSTYPYFHPRYAAQMIKDPSIPAVAGYLAAMLMNPNNHAYEGGPATTEMEIEFVDDLLRLVGFEEGGRATGWGHLCSGGSLANLEALWAVRESRPDGRILFSRASHYSWKRNASILRCAGAVEVEVDAAFRLDPGHLEDLLKQARSPFVVANLGTTGTGSVDPIDAMLDLREKYGFHLHVDAAYGGYTRTCLRGAGGALLPSETVVQESGLSKYVDRQLRALSRADSITIDPHKHGLVPYGVGAVLYRDEALKGPLLNTAPYTYHLKDRPNLGLITLEGSRPGAAAAACWLVNRVLPLDAAGHGAIVAGGIRVARDLHAQALRASGARPLHRPDLDILCLLRTPDGGTGAPQGSVTGAPPGLAAIDRATDAAYRRLSVAAGGAPPVLLSRFTIPADMAARALPGSVIDAEAISALRLVLMKHWLALPGADVTLREVARAVLEG